MSLHPSGPALLLHHAPTRPLPAPTQPVGARPLSGDAITRRLVAAAARQPRYEMPRTDDDVVPLHLNENLLGIAADLPAGLAPPSLADLARYPTEGDRPLQRAVAAAHGVDPEAVFVNTGASAILNQIFAAFANTGATALLPAPTWSYYHTVLASCAIRWHEVPLRQEARRFVYDRDAWLDAVRRRRPSLVAIISPNNPTGNRIGNAEIIDIAGASPDSLVMIDEAYHGLCAPDPVPLAAVLAAAPNVVFVRTFSKAYGLAGLRVGYAVAGRPGQALLGQLPVPFGIPAFAQQLAIARLADDAFLAAVRGACERSREALRRGLQAAPGFVVHDSDANFALVRTPTGRGRAVRDHLRRHGYLVKLLDGELTDHLRITMAAPPVMERVAELIAQA